MPDEYSPGKLRRRWRRQIAPRAFHHPFLLGDPMSLSCRRGFLSRELVRVGPASPAETLERGGSLFVGNYSPSTASTARSTDRARVASIDVRDSENADRGRHSNWA